VDPKKIDGMQISQAQMKKNMAKFNKAEKKYLSCKEQVSCLNWMKACQRKPDYQ
jgi:hypothetical protein